MAEGAYGTTVPERVVSSAATSNVAVTDAVGNSNEAEGNDQNKRQAQFGQWTTPPHPFFPAVPPNPTDNSSTTDGGGGQSSASAQVQSSAGIVPGVPPNISNITVPSEVFKGANPADYPALEEAYRRGAAAAVALSRAATAVAQHQSLSSKTDERINSAASCPNLAEMMHPGMMPSHPFSSSMTAPKQPMSMEVTGAIASNSSTDIKASAKASSERKVSANVDVNVQHPAQAQQWFNPQVARCVSMPEMAQIGSADNRVQLEEEKRQKRLARNRASARLRRLRKKNLVESYEHEVGVLESALTKLKSHQWGSGNCEGLIQALSMERGQQHLDENNRIKLIVNIVNQQRDQVQSLMDAHLETMMLTWMGKVSQGEATVQENSEEGKLVSELADVLRLTPEQQVQLSKMDDGREEQKAIATIDICLEAIMNNNWLMNDGVEECTNQFASILNPSQMSKFMIWTDQNSDAIDCLDYVNAPPASAPPSNSPIFSFGVDQADDESNQDQK